MPTPSLISILLTGSLYIPDPAAPDGRRRVVFQRTHKDFGNLPSHGTKGRQQRAHVIPADPRTLHQQALRARFAAATAAWHALDPDSREAYRQEAKTLPYTGFNLWIRTYCRDHPIDPAAYALAQQQLADTNTFHLIGNPAHLDPVPTSQTTTNLARWLFI